MKVFKPLLTFGVAAALGSGAALYDIATQETSVAVPQAKVDPNSQKIQELRREAQNLNNEIKNFDWRNLQPTLENSQNIALFLAATPGYNTIQHIDRNNGFDIVYPIKISFETRYERPVVESLYERNFHDVSLSCLYKGLAFDKQILLSVIAREQNNLETITAFTPESKQYWDVMCKGATQ